MSFPDHSRRSELGVTLIELVVSISIISIALAGTLHVMLQTTSHSADPMLEQQALAIAESYLEEIVARPFYDPDLGAGGGACPTPEASRPIYDNICDYDGLDDSGPVDQMGSAVAGLDPYRVRVNVDTSATLGTLSGSSDVLRVDVRVTALGLIDITISGYRTDF